jgi:uncharacterized membrane protein YgaE (UPF0421/DUF939 family)
MASAALGTAAKEADSVRGRLGSWLDAFVGSDPGLNRFRAALLMLLTVGLALAGESVLLNLTHALQIGAHAAPPSTVAKVNHEALIVALLLGGIFGMVSCLGVMDRTAKGQAITMVFLPFPMVGALALGLAIGGNRTVSLIWLVVVLAVGTYLRRFGPRGFVAGLVLFIGDFFGFFLHGALKLSDLDWLSAEIGVGVLCALLVRFTLFYPRPAKALARTQRSFAALTRNVAELALALFDDPAQSERRARRLQRQAARLGEAALMIDAQLGDPGALPDGTSGRSLHQRLFDLELALTNVARFAEALGRVDLPTDQREQVRAALLALVARDGEATKAHATELMAMLRGSSLDSAGEIPPSLVTAHRFAASVIDLVEASTGWNSVAAPSGEQGARFQPSALLFGGWLPGSTQVSATASQEPGRRFGDRATLSPFTRTAIQMGVAVGAAILLGDVLSEKRFYWAVLAAFMTFMGTNNQGEQTRRAIARVVGTIVGIVAGSLLVSLIGNRPHVAIVVILLSLSLGIYLMRISYAFLIVGFTITVSQLYVQLGEFTNGLLLQRLEETAIGAAVTIAVVTLVLPLRTRRVLRVAMRSNIEATAKLIAHATARLLGDQGDQGDAGKTLRAEARDVDASYQTLITTAAPIRRSLFGTMDEDVGSSLRQAAGSHYYARNLAADVEVDAELDRETRADIERGSATLGRSLAVVAGAFTGPRDGTYTRSASLFDQAEQRLQRSQNPHKDADLALRDLRAIDETMADMAEALHLEVTDYDTFGADANPRGGSNRQGSLQA